MRAWICLALLGCGSSSTDSPDASDAALLDTPAPIVEASTDATDAGDASTSTSALVVRKIFFGETDRSFVTSVSAWKDFGLDIDGKKTTTSSTDVCKLAMGAPVSVQVDGTDGVDNSFGKNVIPILQAIANVPFSKPTSDAIEKGLAPSLALHVDGLGAAPDYATLASFTVKVFGPQPPTWLGDDAWAASSRGVMGAVSKPLVTYPSGSMSMRVFKSGLAAQPVTLEVAFASAALALPLRHVQLQANVASDDKSATLGVVSAVVSTNDLIAALKQLVGQFDASLCSGSTFDALAAQIKQASDILVDGTQDPQKPCDAISIGLGFEASAAQIGAVVMDPALNMPCP